MPGIFQHEPKVGRGIGNIDPPSCDEDDDEDDFAQSRKDVKKKQKDGSSAVSDL